MTTETTVATDTATDTAATTAAAAAVAPAPERLPESREVPAVRRRASCDYWDLAACTWVRCPDS
jgi:hypothetical protein